MLKSFLRMTLHPRRLIDLLRRRLSSRPITVLTGARQTGKTTLVRKLLPAGGDTLVYFSLDDPDERLRLAADPVRRLDHGSRLVVLDEVQKQPALLDAVKLLADRGEGRRFLMLGSARTAPTPAPSPRCSAPWPCAASRATPGASASSSRAAARWNRSPRACGPCPTGGCSGRPA